MLELRLVRPSGKSVSLPNERTVLGRDPGCDVVVRGGSVSRQHAVIERRDDGWLLIDQKSANGTFVNGQRIIQAILQGDQELRLGDVNLAVVIEDKSKIEAATPSAPSSRPAPISPPSAVRTSDPLATQALGGMTREAAASLLGVWPGASAAEVRKHYQKLYNDFQIRLTNAPTPSLKRMYRKSIQDLKMACEVLCPGIVL